MLQIRKYDATMSSLQTTLDSLRAEDSHVTLMLEKKQVSLSRKEMCAFVCEPNHFVDCFVFYIAV